MSKNISGQKAKEGSEFVKLETRAVAFRQRKFATSADLHLLTSLSQLQMVHNAGFYPRQGVF